MTFTTFSAIPTATQLNEFCQDLVDRLSDADAFSPLSHVPFYLQARPITNSEISSSRTIYFTAPCDCVLEAVSVARAATAAGSPSPFTVTLEPASALAFEAAESVNNGSDSIGQGVPFASSVAMTTNPDDEIVVVGKALKSGRRYRLTVSCNTGGSVSFLSMVAAFSSQGSIS